MEDGNRGRITRFPPLEKATFRNCFLVFPLNWISTKTKMGRRKETLHSSLLKKERETCEKKDKPELAKRSNQR